VIEEALKVVDDIEDEMNSSVEIGEIEID